MCSDYERVSAMKNLELGELSFVNEHLLWIAF